jgi:putative acetyltransferase
MSVGMDILIREEKEKDRKEIYKVNKLAVGQENESILIDKIREGENFIPGLSLIAESKGRLVGHILLSKIKITGSSVFDTLILAPLAVIPAFQKKGIGSRLVKRSVFKAKELGFNSIIVVGHKEYYPRFGFEKASKWNLKCPFRVPDEAFMAIELTKKALEDKAGTIEFPDEFIEAM